MDDPPASAEPVRATETDDAGGAPDGEGASRPSSWRLPVEILVALALACCAVGIALRWVDSTARVVPVAQAAFPIAGLGALLALVLAASIRSWRLCAAALIVAVLPGALAVQSLIPHTVSAADSDEVIMVSNLEFGRADASAIVKEVRQRQVTSLVLVEVSPASWEALKTAGITTSLPHHLGRQSEDAGGTMILSAHPLELIDDGRQPRRFDEPAARVKAPERPYVLHSVHPLPPQGRLVGRWREHLRDLEAWRAAQPADVPLVMAGDFNASSAHPGFRGVADTMTDAQRATGAGWVRTWPRGRPYPPFVQIDHVLVRRMDVVDAGTAVIPQTDHAAVWARVRVSS